jgi:penicillin-binding protein 1A
MTPEALAMMDSMMGEAVRIGTAKRAEVPGWQAAGKTGTSQDFRDAWFCGFTAHLVTVVWVGNDDNSPTKHASGSNLPVQIWSQYMTAAHRGVPVASLPGVNAQTLAADASPSRGDDRGLWSGGHQVRDLPAPLRAPIRFLKGLFGG